MKNKTTEAFLIILTVNLILVGVAAIGIEIPIPFTGDKPSTFKFLTLDKMFDFSAVAENKQALANIDKLLENENDDADAKKVDSTSSQFLTNPTHNGKSALTNFFNAIKNESSSKVVRVAHYGDSHIEGDRMTRDIREALQKKFGGTGSGFFPLTDITSNVTIFTKSTPNWERHTVFTNKISGGLYGLSGMVFRFSHYGTTETKVKRGDDTSNTSDDEETQDKESGKGKKGKSTTEDTSATTIQSDNGDTSAVKKKSEQNSKNKKGKKKTTPKKKTESENPTPSTEDPVNKEKKESTEDLDSKGASVFNPAGAISVSPADNLSIAKFYNLYPTKSGISKAEPVLMASVFSGVTDFLQDESGKDSVIKQTAYYNSADINLDVRKFGDYTKVTLMYGKVPQTCRIKGYDANTGERILNDELSPSEGFRMKDLHFSSSTRKFKLEFYADRSPDLYGINFDGATGVQVDNYGIRGHGGDGLMLINTDYLAKQIKALNTRFIILQFGANSTPYYKTPESFKKLEELYYNIIMKLRDAAPDISILIVGVGDMAGYGSGPLATLPNLPGIIEAQKNAANRANCAFFDMFNAMGGTNSIQMWVGKGLAVRDGHLSERGEKILSREIVNAIFFEYDKFRKSNNRK